MSTFARVPDRRAIAEARDAGDVARLRALAADAPSKRETELHPIPLDWSFPDEQARDHKLVEALVPGVRCTACGFAAALIDGELPYAVWAVHARWCEELGFTEPV